MRTALKMAALGVALVGVVFWLFGGPNLGWTKTSVPVAMKDPVTELDYVEWQQNFVPGVDFLGAALGLAGILFVSSCFVKASVKNPIQKT